MNEDRNLSRRNLICKNVIIDVDYGDDYHIRYASCAICESEEEILSIGNEAGICQECIKFAFNLFNEGKIEKFYSEKLLGKDCCSSFSKIKHCE